MIETKALSLYQAEHALQEIFDTDIEEALTPEEDAEAQAVLAEAIQFTIQKREDFGLFLLWIDQQSATARQEIHRLRQRIERMEKLSERLRRYGVAAIRSLGTDHKGKFRKLAGRTITLFIRALPASVRIFDEAAVPAQYKRVTVQMSARLFEDLAATTAPLAELPIKEVSIDKEAVRKALERGLEVPGADLNLSGHDHALVVK